MFERFLGRRGERMLLVAALMFLGSPRLLASDSKIRYAEHFGLEKLGPLTVVRVSGQLREWGQGSREVERLEDVVVLRPRGDTTPLPDRLSRVPVIETPVRTVATNEEGDEAFLQALDATDRLVAVGGPHTFDDEVHQAVKNGRLKQLGYSWHAPPNLDVAIQLDPDVFFMQLASLDHAPVLPRARKLGVATVPVLRSLERDYLGRAEWIKYFGAFLGREEQAAAVFAKVEERVRTLRARVREEGRRVRTLWAYSAGRQKWMTTVRGPDAQLLEDAGGENPFRAPEDPREKRIEAVSTERLLEKGGQARCWIIGDVHATGLPSSRVMDGFRAWKEDCLYGNTKRNKRGGNGLDWYQRGLVRPDIVLADLVAILNPSVHQQTLEFFETYKKGPAR